MLASNDPAQIAALAQKINDDLNAAFGLLTPEQQQEYLGQFTQNITDLNTTVEDKLNEIRDNVTTAVGDTLTEASNNLSLAADKFTTAANTADNAANTNLAAANTPLQVDVTTHDGAPAEVNVSGG
jgi:DNA repair ATPase RecN